MIDNKPVVGMYAVSQLMSYFGGTAEGVKAELDYLRQACVDAGFDGCYIIMSNSSGNSGLILKRQDLTDSMHTAGEPTAVISKYRRAE